MRNSFLALLILALIANSASAQRHGVQKGTVDTVTPYGKSYHKAYLESDDSLARYLKKNLHYPDAARESFVEGMVAVRFFVDEHGEISDVKLLRGIGAGCDEEAVRVVKNMPRWTPARYKNRPVRSVVTLPVQFKLE